MKSLTTKPAWKSGFLVLLVILCLGATLPAAAQKNNNKNGEPAGSDSAAIPQPMIAIPDSQAVDRAIGEALGYWQIGDVDSLHKYYADDVTVVSGDWTPPVIGWDNYVKAYNAQRARVAGGRMERSNTFIKVNGNVAWATYQFVFTAIVDGKPAEVHGHTSLVLNRVASRWLITLNHSSVVDTAVLNTTPVPADATPSGRP
jgi:ketosteroid isomerase-like protein